MRVVRPALLLTAAAAVALASTASGAAPVGPRALTFSDPAGDAAPSGAYDITAVTATTSGVITKTGKGKSKGNAVYTPKALVLSMTLAEAPSTTPGTLYEVDMETSTCGYLYVYFTPGVDGSGSLVECGSEPDETGSTATNIEVEPVVTGKTITWTLPFSMLPKEIKPGTSVTDFQAYSTQVDPVTGVVGPYLVASDLNFDNATSDATYKVG